MPRTLKELDEGQLGLMWSMLQLKPKSDCTVEEVESLEENLDFIRQALIQKTAGQRKGDPKSSVDFEDLGTYINLVVVQALSIYVNGGLTVLKKALMGGEDKSC